MSDPAGGVCQLLAGVATAACSLAAATLPVALPAPSCPVQQPHHSCLYPGHWHLCWASVCQGMHAAADAAWLLDSSGRPRYGAMPFHASPGLSGPPTHPFYPPVQGDHPDQCGVGYQQDGRGAGVEVGAVDQGAMRGGGCMAQALECLACGRRGAALLPVPCLASRHAAPCNSCAGNSPPRPACPPRPQSQGPADGRQQHYCARGQAGGSGGGALPLLLLPGPGGRRGGGQCVGTPTARQPRLTHPPQALRLFVHYPFLVRASLYCRASGGLEPAASDSAGGALLEPAADGGDCLAGEAVKTCLRGQTFFSLGLRFLYAFIPLVSRAHVGWPGHGAAAGTGEARLQWPPQAAVVSGQSAVLPPRTGHVVPGRHVAAAGHAGGGHPAVCSGPAVAVVGPPMMPATPKHCRARSNPRGLLLLAAGPACRAPHRRGAACKAHLCRMWPSLRLQVRRRPTRPPLAAAGCCRRRAGAAPQASTGASFSSCCSVRRGAGSGVARRQQQPVLAARPRGLQGGGVGWVGGDAASPAGWTNVPAARQPCARRSCAHMPARAPGQSH